MSTKYIVWIVIVILVLLGLWYWWDQSNATQAPATQQAAAIGQTTSTASTGSQQASSGAASGDSNADLNADLSTIDTQTNDANTASASVDQGFNDQQVQQSQL
jgi:hypothetical protein